MNRISEFIIRLLSPKPKEGEILVMPYVAKSQKGISKRRNITSDAEKGIKKSGNVKSDTDEDWNGIAYLGSLIEKCEEWSLSDHK